MTTLSVGDSAPDFTLPTDSGEQFALSRNQGKKVVVYFYPKDDTPGCTLEAQDFRDLQAQFSKANTVLIGISKDSVAKHCKFKAKYDLNFALGSDESGDVCERYGVWVEKSMYGKKYMGIQRATFLISAKGVITDIWPKVNVTGHAKEVLEAAQNIQ